MSILLLELLLLLLALSLLVLALPPLLENRSIIVHSAPVVVDAMLLSRRGAWGCFRCACGHRRQLWHPDRWCGVPCLWPPDRVRIMEVGRYSFT
jgi:hypothetical protein